MQCKCYFHKLFLTKSSIGWFFLYRSTHRNLLIGEHLDTRFTYTTETYANCYPTIIIDPKYLYMLYTTFNACSCHDINVLQGNGMQLSYMRYLQFRNISVLSTVWCFDYKEGLCKECKEHHLLNKASRGHSVIPVNEYQKLPINSSAE